MPFFKQRVDATHENFGSSLRELRELRGYSYEQLSQLTGIHPMIIRNLEEDRFENLADPYYAVRHVRSLAQVLEGRTRYFLDKYQAALKARHISHQHRALLPPCVGWHELRVVSRVVTFVGCAAVVTLITLYLTWQARLMLAIPKLIVTSPTESAVLDSPRVSLSGKTAPGAQVTVNGAVIVVEADGNFQARLDVPRGLSTIRIEARRRYGSAVAIERHVAFQSSATPTTTTTDSAL